METESVQVTYEWAKYVAPLLREVADHATE